MPTLKLKPGGELYLIVENQPNSSELISEPERFTVKLDYMLDFTTNDYEVALVNMTCTVGTQNRNRELNKLTPILVYLEQVKRQYHRDSWQTIIRYTCLRKDRFQVKSFSDRWYIPLQPYKTDTFTFSIRQASDRMEFTGLKDITTCSLHLRRKKSMWPID